MPRPKRKGTSAESAVVAFLRQTWWPHAERRALAGAKDLGDVTGTPGICWEVKAGTRLCIPEWLHQTETERANSGADLGVLVVKPKGVGVLNVNRWWAIQPLDQATALMHGAGYGSKA